MKPRQSLPEEWLVTDERMGQALLPAVRRLPRGSGVLFRHHSLPPGDRARLLRRMQRIATARALTLIDEASGKAARVHGMRELRQARLRGARLMLVSPLFATRSHPGWRPLPRMRAAALARLAGGPVLALGGMGASRFARVKALGFHGWAGIDVWLKKRSRT